MSNNRAARRRMEREARKNNGIVTTDPPVIKRYTQDEFNTILYKTDYDARVHAVQMMMVVYALADHRVHKHGHQRLMKTQRYVEELMQDINDGKATFEDYKKQCLEETGINFVL